MTSDKKLLETYNKTIQIFYDYINRISNELDSKDITIEADLTFKEMDQLSENLKIIKELDKDLNGLKISNFDADKELKNYTQWNAEDIIYQTPKMLEFIIDYLQEFRTTLKEYNILPRQFREACFLYRQFNDGKYSVDKVEKSLKILEIIKHKEVNVGLLNLADWVSEYNKNYGKDRILTQEEFELLKEWLDDDK